jgi:hypothetical protein
MPEKSKVTTQPSARNKTSVSNAIKLDANNPVPFELSGNSFYFFEQSYKYIPFLGTKDDFFNILLEARLLSPTQNACINTRKTYCVANGLTISEIPADKTLKEFDQDLYDFVSSVNNRDESINTVVGDIFEAFDTFGNVFIEIVKGFVYKKPFVMVYVWNTPECRLAQPADEQSPSEAVVRSKRFLRQGIMIDFKNVTQIPLMNKRNFKLKKNWLTDAKGVSRTVIHLKNKMSGYPYYGMPQSVGSLTHQVLEYRGARYNLDLLENNLNQGGIMVIKGNMTQEEATKKAQLVNKQHAGAGKAGRWTFIATESGIDGSEMHPFDTQKEGSYLEQDKSLEAKIIFQNRWNKVLAGLDDGSALGKGNDYIRTIYDIALKTVIIPQQDYVMENFVRPFFQIVDDHMRTSWSKYTWSFKNSTPASFIQMLNSVDGAVQRNEVRSELGLTPDDTEKGKEYLSSPAKSAIIIILIP